MSVLGRWIGNRDFVRNEVVNGLSECAEVHGFGEQGGNVEPLSLILNGLGKWAAGHSNYWGGGSDVLDLGNQRLPGDIGHLHVGDDEVVWTIDEDRDGFGAVDGVCDDMSVQCEGFGEQTADGFEG